MLLSSSVRLVTGAEVEDLLGRAGVVPLLATVGTMKGEEGVEIFPGAGGWAVLAKWRRELDIFPAGGTEELLDSFWGGFLPENGTGVG